MKKQSYVNAYNFTMTVDHVGGLLRTDLYQLESGNFNAYSSYWKDEDEEIVGFAESCDKKEAIQLSREDLRKEWLVEQERISSDLVEEVSGDILYMASGEILAFKELKVIAGTRNESSPS